MERSASPAGGGRRLLDGHEPDAVRQLVILVVSVRLKAAYEIYAHAAVAKARHEISDARLATLAAGERAGDLTEQEAAGYDVRRLS